MKGTKLIEQNKQTNKKQNPQCGILNIRSLPSDLWPQYKFILAFRNLVAVGGSRKYQWINNSRFCPPHAKSVSFIVSVQRDLLTTLPTLCHPCRDTCGASFLWCDLHSTASQYSTIMKVGNGIKRMICMACFGLLLKWSCLQKAPNATHYDWRCRLAD